VVLIFPFVAASVGFGAILVVAALVARRELPMRHIPAETESHNRT
jgi:hypothetical protein